MKKIIQIQPYYFAEGLLVKHFLHITLFGRLNFLLHYQNNFNL